MKYDPAHPTKFLMNRVGDLDVVIPNLTPVSVAVLDPVTSAPLASTLPGQAVKIVATVNNAGPSAVLSATLRIDSDTDGENGYLYDSSVIPPVSNINLTFGPGARTFEWLCRVPTTANPGGQNILISFFDQYRVLILGEPVWLGALNVRAFPIPGRIEVENYKGGRNVGYYDTTAGNQGDATQWTDNVDVEACAEGGQNVAYIKSGEWLVYNVVVTEDGNYSMSFRMASAKSTGKTVHLELDGVALTGAVNFNTKAAGWQVWKSFAGPNVNLRAGSHLLKLSMDTADFNANYIDFTRIGPLVNEAPAVNAGPDQVVSMLTPKVALSATASDDGIPVGATLSCAWTVKSGPSGSTFADAGKFATTVTVTQAGTYVFQAAVSDTALVGKDTVQVTVLPPPTMLPGVVQAERYRAGGEGVAYHDTTAGNTGAREGGSAWTDDVDVEACSAGGWDVGWIINGEWLSYEVAVAADTMCDLDLKVASGEATTKTLHLELDGVNISGPLAFSTGGAGWQVWQTITRTGLFLPAGQHILKIRMDSSNFNLDSIEFRAASGVPNLAPVVDAGADQSIRLPLDTVTLNGSVSDDGEPTWGSLSSAWTKQSGPGTVTFGNPAAAVTTARFSAAGTYVLRLTATDGAKTSFDDTTVTVLAPYLVLPARIEAERYNAGGEGVGYHDTTAGNSGAAYGGAAWTDDVDVETCIQGGYDVGWVVPGEWLAFDVNVPVAGLHDFVFRVASKKTTAQSLRLQLDGAPLAGPFSFNTGGSGWQTWKSFTLSGVSLPAGNHVLKIQLDGEFNLDFVDVVKVP